MTCTTYMNKALLENLSKSCHDIDFQFGLLIGSVS